MKYFTRLFKIRKLTKRENVLLVLLLFTLLFWISNRYIITPQNNTINSLNAKKLQLDKEMLEINRLLGEEDSAREEVATMKSTILELGNSYFPNLDQTQLIYYVEDVLMRNSIKLINMSFSEINSLTIDDFEVKYIHIKIPFEGKYEDIVQALNDFKGGYKVIIESLYLSNINKESTEGEVSLKVFSLEDVIDLPLNKLNLQPRESEENYIDFYPFSEEGEDENNEDANSYKSESETKLGLRQNVYNENTENIIESITPFIEKEVIHNFKNEDYRFSSSGDHIRGNTELFVEDEECFLRFEFFMEENNLVKNRAYINIKPIKFINPQSRLYLRVKSFNYSSGDLGVRLKTYNGQAIDLFISKGIEWLGWGDVIFYLPNNLSYYPLEITDIFYEITNQFDEINVLLFDKLEAEVIEDINIMSDFYVIQGNETIYDVSNKIYGSDIYVKEIIKNNNLSSNRDLKPGKILILKRR